MDPHKLIHLIWAQDWFSDQLDVAYNVFRCWKKARDFVSEVEMVTNYDEAVAIAAKHLEAK